MCGKLFKIESSYYWKLFLIRLETVSYIINLITVNNLFNLPKSYVIFEDSFILNQPFPISLNLSLMILVIFGIQVPFSIYINCDVAFSYKCLNSSEWTAPSLLETSNMHSFSTKLHSCRMSDKALETSALTYKVENIKDFYKSWNDFALDA